MYLKLFAITIIICSVIPNIINHQNPNNNTEQQPTEFLKLIYASNSSDQIYLTPSLAGYYLTHELYTSYAYKALENKALLSTSFFVGNDPQQAKSPCKFPVLYTRIVDPRAGTKLGVGGSNGQNAAVMFVIYPEIVDHDVAITSPIMKTIERLTGTDFKYFLSNVEKIQKICYSYKSDAGKSGYAPEPKIMWKYNIYTALAALGDVTGAHNEQAFGAGIEINTRTTAAIVYKLGYVTNDKGQICLVSSEASSTKPNDTNLPEKRKLIYWANVYMSGLFYPENRTNYNPPKATTFKGCVLFYSPYSKKTSDSIFLHQSVYDDIAKLSYKTQIPILFMSDMDQRKDIVEFIKTGRYPNYTPTKN